MLSFTDFTKRSKRAFVRFPVTLTWVTIGSFYCIYKLGDQDSGSFFERETAVVLTLVLGVSWFIGAQLLLERHPPKKSEAWLKVLVVVLLGLFYWHLPNFGIYPINPVFTYRFFLFFIAGHLLIFFAPFAAQWNKEAYWNYLKTLVFTMARSAFFSGVLFLGLVLALQAVKALFNILVPDERFGQLFVFCLGIVNTWLFLSDFPQGILQRTTIHFHNFLEIFLKYILIPLIVLYLIILYVYCFKIVFFWELPQGWVSYLVSALALLGFLVQLIIHPIQKSGKFGIITYFYPWFYILLLPLLVLLFVAILRRIFDYGITENRYLMLLVALWILGVTLYLLLSKIQRIRVLPLSLFVLTLFPTFGFWGVFEVSKRSQIHQFKVVLDSVTDHGNVATNEQYQKLSSILTYLFERKSLSKVSELVGFSLTKNETDSLIPNFGDFGYINAPRILDSLKITQKPYVSNALEGKPEYFSYSTNEETVINQKISGYTHLSSLKLYGDENKTQELGSYTVRYDAKELSFILVPNTLQKELLALPLKEKLHSLTAFGMYSKKTPSHEMQLEAKNDSLGLTLIFTHVSFYKLRDSISLTFCDGLLLLKQP